MIGILDYGMGNLGSVTNACQFLGLPAQILTQPAQMDACDAVILPGVGAFGDCMSHLESHGFVAPVKKWIADDRPFLGICLGLHMLFEGSDESPGVAGLGILPGRITRLPSSPEIKVPHMGWNTVAQVRRNCPLFTGIPDASSFYFVHSYCAQIGPQPFVAGETTHGRTFASVVWRDNVIAAQFHPEKSQKLGLQMYRNFYDWALQPQVTP